MQSIDVLMFIRVHIYDVLLKREVPPEVVRSFFYNHGFTDTTIKHSLQKKYNEYYVRVFFPIKRKVKKITVLVYCLDLDKLEKVKNEIVRILDTAFGVLSIKLLRKLVAYYINIKSSVPLLLEDVLSVLDESGYEAELVETSKGIFIRTKIKNCRLLFTVQDNELKGRIFLTEGSDEELLDTLLVLKSIVEKIENAQ